MASSGSYNFATDRDTLITDALLYINGIGEGETPSANLVTEASRVLNMIMKLHHADGMPTWAIKRGYILPFTDASSINTNSHVVTTYDHTTISADEASGQTVISVTSATDFSASDQIGIEQDDGTMLWTTISSISSNDITIATALTAAAAAGNHVYGYTASSQRVEKPIRIIQADLLDVTDDTSTEIDVISREDYFSLSNRTSEGSPNSLYYTIRPSSDTALETNGQIFIYPRFENGDNVIEFSYQRPYQDFDASTDEPDCPQAFYLPLMLELAALLGPRFNVPIEERRAIQSEARRYFEDALDTLYEEGSLFITPDIETNG